MPLSLRKSLYGVLGVGYSSGSEGTQEQYQPPGEPPESPSISVEYDAHSSQLNPGVADTGPARVDQLESGYMKPCTHSKPASPSQTSAILYDLEPSCGSTTTSKILTLPLPTHGYQCYMDESGAAAGKTTSCILWPHSPQGNAPREQFPPRTDVHTMVITPIIQEL